MARMPIHNETDYPLTDTMRQHIIRDAQEHFGEQVRSIGNSMALRVTPSTRGRKRCGMRFPRGFLLGPYYPLTGDRRRSRGAPGSQRCPRGRRRLHLR
jgi:hypothetical protein